MPLTLIHITPDKATLLESFLRTEGGDAAVDGLRVSRETYDLLASDSFWLIVAQVDDEPAGLAAVARLPKADARVGFLYVDERQKSHVAAMGSRKLTGLRWCRNGQAQPISRVRARFSSTQAMGLPSYWR